MRNGVDARPERGARKALGAGAATWIEMMLQVARDYPGLPDVRTLTVSEIVFFYNGLRRELKDHTRRKPTTVPKPRKPPRR